MSADDRNAQAQSPEQQSRRNDNEIWYCREYWTGDSRDGTYLNGDGYHYFEMKGRGTVLRAFEYYETDEGEEHAMAVPELAGINWFDFFGFEDEELLEQVALREFLYVEQLAQTRR